MRTHLNAESVPFKLNDFKSIAYCDLDGFRPVRAGMEMSLLCDTVA